MQPLNTTKTLSFNNGVYSIEEFETESYQRYEARCVAIRENHASDFAEAPIYTAAHPPQLPVFEPLKTWDLGSYESDPALIAHAVGLWLERRSDLRLTETEIENLRSILAR